MSGEKLKPEIIALFLDYEASHRDVFLDEILRFIWGANHTRQELNELRKVAVERGKSLRLSTGGRQSQPSLQQKAPHREKPLGGPRESEQSYEDDSDADDSFSRDWSRHGHFRTICMALGDIPANRPLFLERILQFVLAADKAELAAIREVVTRCTKARRGRRGRPSVREDEEIMGKARLVAWMRHIEGKKQREIGEALGIQDSSPDAKATTVRRLEDYLAAAIWRTIPDTTFAPVPAGRSHPEHSMISICKHMSNSKLACLSARTPKNVSALLRRSGRAATQPTGS
ncbi:MAG: hypothetical protein WBD87_16315 [Candidatus Acidiferrales bacterium]